MSGIVALFDSAGVDRERLVSMHDRLCHRGPDGDGIWCDTQVGLGHQQLQTTPEAAYDDQPYRENGDVIVADVRLDNRAQLLEQLSLREPSEQIPVSQLLLSAYRKWGTDCLNQLVGPFAFVIWDSDNDWLFCARDHFGIKPFYYYKTENVFAVASEQKGLLCLPTVPGVANETKIGDFLLGMYEDKERTFFESIRRLPPACAMKVGQDGTQSWQYWNLDPTHTITLNSNAAYERRFRELFEKAVGSRLRSEGPVGAALSGGLDSSSVTVVARDLLPSDNPLHTFSNVYDDAPSSDEREFIETVTQQDGIESHYIFPENVGLLPDKKQLWRYFDKPPHNTMHFAEWERTKCVKNSGVSAILGGTFGDVAIGYGLDMLPELFWTGRWRKLYDELHGLSDILNSPMKQLFVQLVVAESVPESVRKVRRKYKGYLSPLEQANPMLNASFVAKTNLQERYTRQNNQGTIVAPRSRRCQRRALLSGKHATNFEALDLLHAVFGIEPRYPFTDKRLVEFSLAIPPTQKLSDGWTRSIVRRALGDQLPDKIQWRPWKTLVNEAFWNALDHEETRIEDLVTNPDPLTPYLNLEALRTSYDQFSEEKNSRDARALWRALSLSGWCNEYQFPAR